MTSVSRVRKWKGLRAFLRCALTEGWGNLWLFRISIKICFLMNFMVFNSLALLLGYLCWAHHWCCGRWHPRTCTESRERGENHLWRSSSHYHNPGNWETGCSCRGAGICTQGISLEDSLEKELLTWVAHRNLTTVDNSFPWLCLNNFDSTD